MKPKKMKVQLRGGFSDRNGIKPENTALQTTALDARTRAALVSMINTVCSQCLPLNVPTAPRCQDFLRGLLADVYAAEVDWSKTYDPNDVLHAVFETLRTDEYDDVLTLLEYIVQKVSRHNNGRFGFRGRFYTAEQVFNNVFEKEYVGYRFLDKKITPITDDVERHTIEEALSVDKPEVKQHFQKAVGFLSDRENPDYANSIKESIIAVERMCSIIVGRATTLSDALKTISKSGVEIHPALKDAFNKLYAYTNDSSGIRHAGQLGGKDATFEEAKFMLVSCSAFVNYLTGVIAKTEK